MRRLDDLDELLTLINFGALCDVCCTNKMSLLLLFLLFLSPEYISRNQVVAGAE